MIRKYLWDIDNPAGYNNRSGHYKTRLEYDFIIKHLSINHKRILDLGGGSGRFAVPLLKKGLSVTILDINEQAIHLCKQRNIKNSFCIDFRDFDENDFDAVLAIELFLVTPPEDVFKVASDSLNDKGLFIFVATNNNSWRYHLHNLRKKKTINLGEFSIEEYKQMLNTYKFSIIDIKGFNWLPFTVNSNNFLIPVFTYIERKFLLNNWLQQSPWLLFACRKEETIYSLNH